MSELIIDTCQDVASGLREGLLLRKVCSNI
jgi:hypothetical protein